jgi:transcriptional regulator with GAF, ATPase, and Fis domain
MKVFENIASAAAPRTPQQAQAVSGCCRKFLGGNMISESVLGLEENRTVVVENSSTEPNVDARLNTLRETVLQLLDEVESLAISRPVDIKRGACFSDEVRQFEVSLIRTALGRTSGSQTRAAKLLGLKPTTLNAKIKRYGIMA